MNIDKIVMHSARESRWRSGNSIARKVQVVAARAWAYATCFGRIPLRCRPQRYHCPHCKWDFARRKKRCCPGCGTLLLIVSDMLSDSELTELRSFWMWDTLKEKWDFIRDWEEHKIEAMRKFEEYVFGRRGALGQDKKTYLPLPRGLQ